MAAMTSKFYYKCVIQYYTDQCHMKLKLLLYLSGSKRGARRHKIRACLVLRTADTEQFRVKIKPRLWSFERERRLFIR